MAPGTTGDEQGRGPHHWHTLKQAKSPTPPPVRVIGLCSKKKLGPTQPWGNTSGGRGEAGEKVGFGGWRGGMATRLFFGSRSFFGKPTSSSHKRDGQEDSVGTDEEEIQLDVLADLCHLRPWGDQQLGKGGWGDFCAKKKGNHPPQKNGPEKSKFCDVRRFGNSTFNLYEMAVLCESLFASKTLRFPPETCLPLLSKVSTTPP